MIQTENNFELGGISIGIAMNSVDYYTNDGKDAETEISNEAMIEQAKAIANTILTRLRQNDALKAVPIVFGCSVKRLKMISVAGYTFLKRLQ